jgi:regulator of replication initiation timing
MSVTNFPAPGTPVSTKKNYKNLVIGALGAALIAVSAYAFYAKSQSDKTSFQQNASIEKANAEKMTIQSSFDASLARLDSMSTINTGLQSQLADKNQEIARVKADIRNILNKKNASVAELNQAKTLIASLNDKIASLQLDIAKLKQDNQLLTNDNIVLKAEKQSLTDNLAAVNTVKETLEKKVDVASTLHASNIVITPVNVKRSGKEKVSTVAKRVDKIVVSFDVDNRIIQPGTTDVYVVVVDPEGKEVSTGTDTFVTREEGSKSYTAKIPVELETAKMKNVEFAFAPGTTFKQGNYTVKIYQNGFLIGSGTRELKKGGLFS